MSKKIVADNFLMEGHESVRKVSKADFTKLGVEHEGVSWTNDEVVELPDNVADALLRHGGFKEASTKQVEAAKEEEEAPAKAASSGSGKTATGKGAK